MAWQALALVMTGGFALVGGRMAWKTSRLAIPRRVLSSPVQWMWQISPSATRKTDIFLLEAARMRWETGAIPGQIGSPAAYAFIAAPVYLMVQSRGEEVVVELTP
jgi:hypothetical protein